MMKFKMIISEAHILMLHENSEIGANFIFLKVELLKLKVFDRPYFNLS
jgi:hypothetical protein